MAHFHKKLRHHVAKHKKSFTLVSTLFSVLFILSAIFFATRNANPSVSELAFTENSTLGKDAGSVIPASCVSGVDTHGGTQTCSNGSVISICSSCPATPSCSPTSASTWSNTTANASGWCTVSGTDTTYSCSDGTSYVNHGPQTGKSCVTCTNSTTYEYSNNNCTRTPTTVISCTDGSTASYPGSPVNTCPVTPVTSTVTTTSSCGTYRYPETNAGSIANYCGACPAGTHQPASLSCVTGSAGTWTDWGSSCSPASCSGCGCIPGSGPTPPPATCSDPAADNYGASGACTYAPAAPAPDLTAGTITPTLITPGTTAALTATITNRGNETTGTWFYNFIQISDADNGRGTITDEPAENMSALDPGRTGTVTASFTPPAEGVYSARACADKSNRGNSGRIPESNEGNNCGRWTTIYVTNAPAIRDVAVSYPNITFVCDNSFSYSASFNETGREIARGSTVSGETITVPISAEGNYTLTCIAGPLNASAVATYVIMNNMSDLSINANPRTVGNNKSTTLSWSVLHPTNFCGIRAEVVCSGDRDSCTQDQLAEEDRINSELQGNTNNNDPYGPGRKVQTAAKKPAPLNNPGNDKALGTKTVQMNKSADFILDCGKNILKKVRVIVSTEQEG